MAVETPGSQSALRGANQRRVMRAVRLAGSLTQAEIARVTGLSAATVSNIVRELRGGGLVVVTPTSSGGRRAQSVSLTRGVGLAIGLELGTDHLRAAVFDQTDEVLADERIPYDVAASAERGLRRAEWLIATLLRQARADRSLVRGVGVAIAGPIDAQTGQMASATILPTWQGIDVAGELGERLALPVHIENDANAGAIGELARGAGRGLRDFAYLKLSAGVGAGLVINGQLYRGAGGFAGELGHITVDEQGRICRCGNRGCLETLVGGPYLLDLLPGMRDSAQPTLNSLVSGALRGDLGSRRVIADAGRAVGAAIAILCNVLNPRRVIVGGELAEADELLLGPIRDAVSRQALPTAAGMVEVVPAALGERAAVVGAAAIVHRTDVEDLDDEESLLA